MQILHLDYQRRHRPFPVLGSILLLCALAAVGQVTRQYLYYTRVLAAWEAREEEMEQLVRRHDPGPSAGRLDKEQLSRELSRANEVLRRIGLPWQELFGAVESAAPRDVGLLAMEPDPDKQLLKIAGEAKDVAAMLAYIRSLEGRPIFRSVTLANHQVQQQDPQRPIRFSLVAAWRDQP